MRYYEIIAEDDIVAPAGAATPAIAAPLPSAAPTSQPASSAPAAAPGQASPVPKQSGSNQSSQRSKGKDQSSAVQKINPLLRARRAR